MPLRASWLVSLPTANLYRVCVDMDSGKIIETDKVPS
jgi:hypothetical protein